jgi:hypothetical protein
VYSTHTYAHTPYERKQKDTECHMEEGDGKGAFIRPGMTEATRS